MPEFHLEPQYYLLAATSELYHLGHHTKWMLLVIWLLTYSWVLIALCFLSLTLAAPLLSLPNGESSPSPSQPFLRLLPSLPCLIRNLVVPQAVLFRGGLSLQHSKVSECSKVELVWFSFPNSLFSCYFSTSGIKCIFFEVHSNSLLSRFYQFPGHWSFPNINLKTLTLELQFSSLCHSIILSDIWMKIWATRKSNHV